MFKELSKNEMMTVVGGGYPVGVPMYYGTQFRGIKMVSSDSGIKCYRWNFMYNTYDPDWDEYDPKRGY